GHSFPCLHFGTKEILASTIELNRSRPKLVLDRHPCLSAGSVVDQPTDPKRLARFVTSLDRIDGPAPGDVDQFAIPQRRLKLPRGASAAVQPGGSAVDVAHCTASARAMAARAALI